MLKPKRNPSSHLTEPANKRTLTSCTDPKVSPVLETIAEIISLIAIGSLGWLALIIL